MTAVTIYYMHTKAFTELFVSRSLLDELLDGIHRKRCDLRAGQSWLPTGTNIDAYTWDARWACRELEDRQFENATTREQNEQSAYLLPTRIE